MNEVVSLKNISFSYNEEKVTLSGVSFDVAPSSYCCIIGHNGSGKSTLAKLIVGLLSPSEGEIYLFGKKLEKKSLKELRRKMGIVFQNPDNQFVGATVEDDIAFGLENRNIPREEMVKRVDYIIDKVGMSDFRSHEPSSLSGGQKQRVAIAGVLSLGVDLIIFDEATAMLDPKGKKEIRELISSLRKENPNLTIISITHDVEEANQSDYVYVINDGKLFSQGTPSEVFSHVDELRKIKLDVPFFYSLKHELIKDGLEIPSSIKNEAELEEYLCR